MAKTTTIAPPVEAKLNDDAAAQDPNTLVELQIQDRRSSGQAVGTRWGKVQFDENGAATIKVPLRDVLKIHELKWLSVDDQAKYLGLEELQPPTPLEVKAGAELEAARAAGTKLAMRNAELEAQIELKAAEYAAKLKTSQDDANAELDKLRAENASLAQALAAANAVVAPPEASKAEKRKS